MHLMEPFFFRGTLSWENGAREGISRGRYPWSDRGATGPQPEGNETVWLF